MILSKQVLLKNSYNNSTKMCIKLNLICYKKCKFGIGYGALLMLPTKCIPNGNKIRYGYSTNLFRFDAKFASKIMQSHIA